MCISFGSVSAQNPEYATKGLQNMYKMQHLRPSHCHAAAAAALLCTLWRQVTESYSHVYIVLLYLEVILCLLNRHVLPRRIALVFEWQSNFQRAPFWFKQRSMTAVLLLLLHQFSTSDQKENYKADSGLSPRFFLHNWMHMGGFSLGQRGFFKCNTEVAATSFSHEESGRPRRAFIFCSYYTSFSLSKTWQFPLKIYTSQCSLT